MADVPPGHTLHHLCTHTGHRTVIAPGDYTPLCSAMTLRRLRNGEVHPQPTSQCFLPALRQEWQTGTGTSGRTRGETRTRSTADERGSSPHKHSLPHAPTTSLGTHRLPGSRHTHQDQCQSWSFCYACRSPAHRAGLFSMYCRTT